MSSLVDRLDAAQRRVRPAAFTVAVFCKAGDDQAGYLSTLLSCYAFLAVFPLLLVLATVLGIVLRDDPGAQQWVLHSALADFPVVGTRLHANIHSLTLTLTGFGLTIGVIGTVWGARGLSTSAQWVCNSIWAVPYTRRGSWVHQQVLGLALLGVVAVSVLVTGAVSGVAGVDESHPLRLEWIGAVGSAAVNAPLFGLGFRLATAREVPTRSLIRVACITAVVWQGLLTLGGYLVSHELRHAEDLYGVFGLVLGLMAWLHVQSRVTVFALELECVRVRGLWPRTLDGPRLEPGDMRAFTAYAPNRQRRDNMLISVDYALADGSQPSAGTRASTPPKSVPASRVPKARPWSPASREAQNASATEDGA
jgi:YihY family inner membrane protein